MLFLSFFQEPLFKILKRNFGVILSTSRGVFLKDSLEIILDLSNGAFSGEFLEIFFEAFGEIFKRIDLT
jgi:hypothetical protein